MITRFLPLIVLALAHTAHADTLIDNIKGFTATPTGEIKSFTAMRVGDDGRIIQLFSADENFPTRTSYHMNGKGQTMLPGAVVSNSNGLSLIKMGLDLLAQKAGIPAGPRKIGPRDRDLAFDAIQTDLLRKGITTFADMGTNVEDWLTYRRAGDEGRLRIRILCYADGIAPMVAIGGGRVTPWLYNGHLRMVGVLLNGHFPPPLASPARNTIALNNDETRLRNEMSHAAYDGFQAAIQTAPLPNGTSPEAQRAKAAIAELDQTYTRHKGQWRILEEERTNAAQFNQNKPVLLSTAHGQRIMAEDRVGALTPGLPADFTLWKEPPASTEADVLTETWVDGARVAESVPDFDPAARSPGR